MILLTLGRRRRGGRRWVCTCIHFCWARPSPAPLPAGVQPNLGRELGVPPICGSVKARLDKEQPPAQESQNSWEIP